MRGVIATFDGESGVGTIRATDQKLYALTRSNLLRRSKEPLVGARVVFRLKQSEVSKAIVVREKDQDGWMVADFFLQVLLYLPIP
jgi:hypothetical protein